MIQFNIITFISDCLCVYAPETVLQAQPPLPKLYNFCKHSNIAQNVNNKLLKFQVHI